jgi:hypothetical protein
VETPLLFDSFLQTSVAKYSVGRKTEVPSYATFPLGNSYGSSTM